MLGHGACCAYQHELLKVFLMSAHISRDGCAHFPVVGELQKMRDTLKKAVSVSRRVPNMVFARCPEVSGPPRHRLDRWSGDGAGYDEGVMIRPGPFFGVGVSVVQDLDACS